MFLKQLASLDFSQPDAAGKVAIPAIPIIVQNLQNPSDEVVEASVTVLHRMSAVPQLRGPLLEKKAADALRDALATAPSDLHAMIRTSLKNLTTEATTATTTTTTKAAAKPLGASSTANSSASTAADTASNNKKELHQVHLNMDGLLGSRAKEDCYIRALLMTDEVTSVTIDRRRELAIVYTRVSDVTALTPNLYDAVQTACDEIQDAAGQQRVVVRRTQHAAYLDDDDDDDAEDAGFFAKGSTNNNNKTASASSSSSSSSGGAKKPGGTITSNQVKSVKSAAERLKERETANASAAGGKAANGWFSGIFSFW